MPGLGYLYDHPLAIASVENPKRWDLELLMAGVPLQAAPDHFLHPGFPDIPFDQSACGGCCVGYAGETIQNAVESEDEGAGLFDDASAWTAYRWLKNGHGSFPGDGIPNVEGSYPEALWKLALAEGLPDKYGNVHKISAYYSHGLASRADFLFLQQAVLAFGPVNLGIPWPANWMAEPSAPLYRMPAPGYPSGGHSITVGGWDIEPDGDWLACIQTWGAGWGGPKGIYRIRADWLYQAPLGPQIIWKTVDIAEAPHPVGGDMVPAKDRTARRLKVPVGTQLYTPDTNQPLVKLGGTQPANVYSPFQISDAQYAVIISTGGVTQLARVDKAAVTVVATDVLT